MKHEFLKILKRLDPLQFPLEQYLIFGSGPLAIRGLRPARDVDIFVTKELWQRLAQNYEVVGKKNNLIRIGCFEIWNDCLNLNARSDEVLQGRDVIEGYPFMNLRDTIEWKKFLNREKDLEDIQLIEKYLRAPKDEIECTR